MGVYRLLGLDSVQLTLPPSEIARFNVVGLNVDLCSIIGAFVKN